MKLRMQITKEKEIRFISHLEYVRTIERAIRRAKLPVAYSEGFNPHLKFSLASALGVGVVSQAELVEIELAEAMEPKVAVEKMAAAMPRGIHILAADITAKNAPALMASAGGADYSVTVPYNSECAGPISAFNEASSVIFVKAAPKQKNKVKEIDVKFYIPHVEARSTNGFLTLTFSCRITPTGSMKAIDLLNTLNEHFAMDIPTHKADVTRLALYKMDTDGNKASLLDEAYLVE